MSNMSPESPEHKRRPADDRVERFGTSSAQGLTLLTKAEVEAARAKPCPAHVADAVGE